MIPANHMGESINDLKGWSAEPPTNATGLMESVQKACATPLRELTDNDLRILVGQKLALEICLPLAVERLRENPWLDASYYPGDLMEAVRRLSDEELEKFPGAREEMDELSKSPKPSFR